MKKLSMFLLVLVMVLTIGTGCGDDGAQNVTDTSGVSADSGSGVTDTPDTSIPPEPTPVAWPDTDFPEGFPEYLEGTVIAAEKYDDGSATARIADTDATAIDTYVQSLVAGGWIPYTGEGSSNGTTLLKAKDSGSLWVAVIGAVNDGSGDFFVSVNSQTGSIDAFMPQEEAGEGTEGGTGTV